MSLDYGNRPACRGPIPARITKRHGPTAEGVGRQFGSYGVRRCWSPRIVYFSGFFVMAGLDPAIHENTKSCNQGDDNVT
jgi:hypothetical protein